MAPVYKVALIQLQPTPVAPEENFNRAAAFIRDAASQGVQLAVLPEYHLTSWVPEHPAFVSSSKESETYLARYQELARELNINIVPGTICMSHTPAPGADGDSDTELHNMAYFIAAGTGDIAGAYQKKNLWHPERPHLTSSGPEPHAAFDTPLRNADGSPVRAGLLVCWDLAFPEAFRALIADGATLIVIPSFWTMSDVDTEAWTLNPDCERRFLEATTVSRAYENTCAVVFVNTGGVTQLAMPIFGALGRIDDDGEKMVIVDMDLALLALAERNYKVRADISGKGWHYGYELVKDPA